MQIIFFEIIYLRENPVWRVFQTVYACFASGDRPRQKQGHTRSDRAIDWLFEASSYIEKIFLISFSEIIHKVVFLSSRSNQYPATCELKPADHQVPVT